MGKFEVVKTATGIVFHLKASNGETIATSEVYNSAAACLDGIESVKKNAGIAPVEDHTVNPVAEQKNPKFEMYVDKAGEFRFRLKAINGQEIAASQAYKEKSSCTKGIESVKKNAFEAEVVRKDLE